MLLVVALAVLAPARASAAAASWWHPTKGLTWQWQLSGKPDLTVPAAVYDLDAVTTSAADVAKLHQVGRKAICYVSVGSYEKYRADASRFPAAVLGKPLDGWPDERWLDIRRWDVLGPIMADRFAMCRQKGFDAVEPDNVDAYSNRTGFGLTAANQLTFNRRIADLAHGMGLAVGLKNDVEQVRALAPYFDFAVNEECASYDECGVLSAFTKAGKPVFHVEYDLRPAQFCPTTLKLGFSSLRKHLSLDAWRQPC
jgi:hypothetical protein